MANSVRQQKFARLIQKELSEIFQRDKHGYLDNAFITIAEVRVSPDLSVAKVYVSMMLAKDKQGTLAKLDLHKKDIRRALGEKIRNQARIVPEIAFFVDEVEENAMRMDDILKNLNIPPASSADLAPPEAATRRRRRQAPPESPKKK
jgi:ribosome-binding factor A